MIRLIFTLIFLQFAILGFCDDELKYNPFTGEWSYESEDASPQYNPFSGEWEYAE